MLESDGLSLRPGEGAGAAPVIATFMRAGKEETVNPATCARKIRWSWVQKERWKRPLLMPTAGRTGATEHALALQLQ